jgi:signal transduction histidine kinase
LVSKPRENRFIILVKNDGFLIPDEMKEKIFDPFFRLKETQAQKGTGIGLALSRSLAQLHKGTITLLDPEEGMNVFCLTLPLRHQNDTNIATGKKAASI